ncbi:unnamed protein product [Dovyalis caffra]|uniref:Uncharacterized protein n=1 Tax=Dovyalis caffra TaxID=77055 RepID=A0AAV1S1Z7_9ROSI|nr:unnamed protein product [Dovyalis caffra]
MKRKQVEEEEEEEENVRLISCKVVEYLEPMMSRDLLFKFPDNSSFDFDYTQSSIWSPLVPRNYSPLDLDLVTPRKIAFGFGSASVLDNNDSSRSGSKKLSSSIKKKKKKKKKKMAISPNAFNVSLSNLKIRKHKVKVSEFSPTPIKASCVPFAAKGWIKVLKAATKHFKKKKKKDPTTHVKLSNYLRDA